MCATILAHLELMLVQGLSPYLCFTCNKNRHRSIGIHIVCMAICTYLGIPYWSGHVIKDDSNRCVAGPPCRVTPYHENGRRNYTECNECATMLECCRDRNWFSGLGQFAMTKAGWGDNAATAFRVTEREELLAKLRCFGKQVHEVQRLPKQ